MMVVVVTVIVVVMMVVVVMVVVRGNGTGKHGGRVRKGGVQRRVSHVPADAAAATRS